MSQAIILPQYPGDFSLDGHTHSQYLTSHQSLTNYATKTYVTNQIAALDVASSSHTHNYAASNHTHNYASSSHTHSSTYAAKSHSHSDYASSSHSHSSDYAAKSHTHSYASTTHTHVASDISDLPTGGGGSSSGSDHTHSAYAAKTHSHSDYASSNHSHSYASTSHTHSGYASNSHTHDASDIKGLSSGGGGGASTLIESRSIYPGNSVTLSSKASVVLAYWSVNTSGYLSFFALTPGNSPSGYTVGLSFASDGKTITNTTPGSVIHFVALA